MKVAAHTTGQLMAAGAVVLALAALAAFSLWGMKPPATTTSAAPTTPVTTPATRAPEREAGDG